MGRRQVIHIPRTRAPTSARSDAGWLTRAILADLYGPPATRAFHVRLWDGTREDAGTADPTFTLVIRRPGALRRMLYPPSELALAEGYLRDDVDIEGDLERAFPLLALPTPSPRAAARIFRRLRALPTDDLAADREPIAPA